MTTCCIGISFVHGKNFEVKQARNLGMAQRLQHSNWTLLLGTTLARKVGHTPALVALRAASMQVSVLLA